MNEKKVKLNMYYSTDCGKTLTQISDIPIVEIEVITNETHQTTEEDK